MASFWAFDHKLSPPTYARTDDSRPKLKFARISRHSTMAANIQTIANRELVFGAVTEDGDRVDVWGRWFTILIALPGPPRAPFGHCPCQRAPPSSRVHRWGQAYRMQGQRRQLVCDARAHALRRLGWI